MRWGVTIATNSCRKRRSVRLAEVVAHVGSRGNVARSKIFGAVGAGINNNTILLALQILGLGTIGNHGESGGSCVSFVGRSASAKSQVLLDGYVVAGLGHKVTINFSRAAQ